MTMQKKLTITIDEDVYAGLYEVVGKRKISRSSSRWSGLTSCLAIFRTGYRQMAADTERETEAMEWMEGTAEDVGDEAR